MTFGPAIDTLAHALRALIDRHVPTLTGARTRPHDISIDDIADRRAKCDLTSTDLQVRASQATGPQEPPLRCRPSAGRAPAQPETGSAARKPRQRKASGSAAAQQRASPETHSSQETPQRREGYPVALGTPGSRLVRSRLGSIRGDRNPPETSGDAPARRDEQASQTTFGRRPGEWPGGVSPPGSLRTRREPLGSPGSHRPAVRAHEPPVREQAGLASATSTEQPARPAVWRRRRLYFRMAQRTRYR